jgi:hypothetical protein
MDIGYLEQKGQMIINGWKMRREKRRQSREEELTNYEFIENIKKARESLKTVRDNFNFVTDSQMTDYYIYMIKAEETKLNYFLSLAKKEGRSNPNFLNSCYLTLGEGGE